MADVAKVVPLLAIATASLAAGAWLAHAYPLAPALVLVLLFLWAALCVRWPAVWLIGVPALLPAIGFASWTGWLTFEELDMLLLATAAGGYGGMALLRRPDPPDANVLQRISVSGKLLIFLAGAACLWSLIRGFTDAGAGAPGWHHGYNEPLNSLRLAKSFPLALLLLPLMGDAAKRRGVRALQWLAHGIAAGLTFTCLAVLWERQAFNGLLDFSSDYRTTALFWEMHVGGAALDGFLALAVPFAVRELIVARGLLRWFAAAAVVALAGYACLTTFSRSVYLAIPTGLALAWVLGARDRPPQTAADGAFGFVKWLLFAVLCVAAFILVFRVGGYRANAAALGVLALAVALGTLYPMLGRSAWILGLPSGVVLGLAGVMIGSTIPKGPYIIFAAVFAGSAALIWRARADANRLAAAGAIGGFIWLTIAAAEVADHWGGRVALHDMLPVLGGLIVLSIWNAASLGKLWPTGLRPQATMVGVAAMLAAIVTVFSAGAYMKGRFDTSSSDLDGRFRHWRESLNLLQGQTDWLWGKGFGRYPESHFFGVRNSEFPGSYRASMRDGRHTLLLSGPRFNTGFGEMLRIAQRVRIEPGPYRVAYDAWVSEDISVHVEVCAQHLLYNSDCALETRDLKAQNGGWRRVEVTLDGRLLNQGSWFAPRLAFFSMAVSSLGKKIEITNVSLIGPDGTELLTNGDFSAATSRWFMLSERIHLPWHIKNIFLNVLFDQGAIGLLAFLALVGAALWRLSFGEARGHEYAPTLAAALAGFLVVGLFDSLLDVPRIAFLFYCLVFLSFSLRGNIRRDTGPRRPPRRAPEGDRGGFAPERLVA